MIQPRQDLLDVLDLISFLNYVRFLNLSVEDRQENCQIQQQQFIEFLLAVHQKSKNGSFKFAYCTHFPTTEQKKIRFKSRMLGNQSQVKVHSQKSLIQNCRIACTGTIKIFLTKQILRDGAAFMNHLEVVSQQQIFQYSYKQSKKNEVGDNPLWFSGLAFNSLGEWIVSAIEKSILTRYFNMKKGKILISSSLCYGYKLLEFYSKLENKEKKKVLQLEDLNFFIKEQIKLDHILEMKFDEVQVQYLPTIKSSFSRLEEMFHQVKDNIEKNQLKNKVKKKNKSKKLKDQPEQTTNHSQSNSNNQQEKTVLTDSIASECTTACQKIYDIHQSDNINYSVSNQKQSFTQLLDQKQIQPETQCMNIQKQQAKEIEEVTEIKQEEQNLKNKKKKNKKKKNPCENLIEQLFNHHLHYEFLKAVDKISISSNQLLEGRIVVFERIRYFIKKFYGIYSSVDAKLFGSNALGLALPTSDIDILLTGFKILTREQSICLLSTISNYLKKLKWVVNCVTYSHAKIPIIKLEINPNIGFFQMHDFREQTMYKALLPNLEVTTRVKSLIKVDITIEATLEEYSHSGCESTQFMKTCINEIPNLNSIVLLLKLILSKKQLNQTYTGGISSYSLFLMVAAYMKEHDCEDKNTAQVFLDVLKFYGEEFQNEKSGLSYYADKSCYFKIEDAMSIVNIYQPLHNRLLSGNCIKYKLIKQEFIRIKTCIQHMQGVIKQDINSLCKTDLKNLLQKKKLDKWLKRYQKIEKMNLETIINQQ